MLESKFALNNLNFKCYIQFFFVRARIGPKKWGGQFDPPPLVNRVLANTLVKEGLKKIVQLFRKTLMFLKVVSGVNLPTPVASLLMRCYAARKARY